MEVHSCRFKAERIFRAMGFIFRAGACPRISYTEDVHRRSFVFVADSQLWILFTGCVHGRGFHSEHVHSYKGETHSHGFNK